MKVWLNGALCEAADARVSALDRGLLYGDGLFESLRCFAGQPFLLGQHLERLAAAAAELELDLDLPPRKVLEEAVGALLAANGLARADARVRVTVTRGAGGEGLWPRDAPAPTVLITAEPVALPPWLEAGGGASAVTSAHRVASGRAHAKSTSFQVHVLAKREAARAGAWEAILRNDRGDVAEGATSNVFVLAHDGALATPPPEAGILLGLTRAVVLRIVQPTLCMDAREAPLPLEELRDAREAFLTSSVAGIVPLVKLDGRAIGDGAPGPVTRAARSAYAQEVQRSFGNGNSKRSDSVM
ncbi:MAG TPA: aminotransferase class IV [Candidatus Thermoplasmatota archaeon]|nr:aminotransferase class IV [Candidatus Thermoplasmatota archaeon]